MYYTNYTPNWFSPDIEDRKSRIEGIDLSEIETKELTQFSDNFRKFCSQQILKKVYLLLSEV